MVYEFTKAALYGIKTFNEKAEEKTRMEKLIMLIDIYEEEVVGVHSVGEKITDKEETRIISKKFGFIKWLVENEKIDVEKLGEKSEYTFIKNGGGEHIIEDVLMLLSIQDEPIEFLVSILK